MASGIFAREATGGAVARGGFEYQDAFVLQNLPRWLSQQAFSHVVSESRGDVEVCYFAGRESYWRTLFEAKGYELTPAAFWSELEDFKRIHRESPGEYTHFALVCRGYAVTVQPLLSMLERLRGVGTSHAPTSPVVESAKQQVRSWLMDKGHEDLAEFVMERVDFITYASENAESAFAGEFERHFPDLDLRPTERAGLKEQFKALVAASSSGPIQRADLEAAISGASPAAQAVWTGMPRKLHLHAGEPPTELRLPLDAYDGPGRVSLRAENWEALATGAQVVAEFLLTSSSRRQLSIDGKHRMSASCVVGFQFAAVRGFFLQIHHNGCLYRTDNHDRDAADFFHATQQPGSVRCAGGEGVVCIGFPTPVGADLAAVEGGALADLPRLELVSQRAVDSVAALNSAVFQAKSSMVQFRSEFGFAKLHLLIKAPSVFAMMLGYRLNGLGQLQLYDWVDGRYIATAELG